MDKKDIISSWVGLRPLVKDGNKKVTEISRKDEIFISEKGLITIAGGKLTGYRKMAQRAVDFAIRSLKINTSIQTKYSILRIEKTINQIYSKLKL